MKRFDPRLYQIGALTLLLFYGIFALRFDVTLFQASLLLTTAIATQAICSWFRSIPFDPRSAAISGLSLSLLLRSDSLILLVAGAAIAVASKFVVRVRGKHIFNPTNIAIVMLMLMSKRVWVSPGQWGNVAFFGFLIACIGGLVVNRAVRGDVTYAFIVSWILLLAGRSLWVGEPLTIPMHRLENGALLLFTFFMISDPKTTPDSRAGRILFAALVAFGGWYINYRLFRTNGILWSLAASALAVPLIDALLPAQKYQWPGAAGSPLFFQAQQPAGGAPSASLRAGAGATRPAIA
jgi:Na+-translocating ferredoxin:NAD+ oxidoreductase RnfD subunit